MASPISAGRDRSRAFGPDAAAGPDGCSAWPCMPWQLAGMPSIPRPAQTSNPAERGRITGYPASVISIERLRACSSARTIRSRAASTSSASSERGELLRLVRALAVARHETWLEADGYPNMDGLREQRRPCAWRRAPGHLALWTTLPVAHPSPPPRHEPCCRSFWTQLPPPAAKQSGTQEPVSDQVGRGSPEPTRARADMSSCRSRYREGQSAIARGHLIGPRAVSPQPNPVPACRPLVGSVQSRSTQSGAGEPASDQAGRDLARTNRGACA
jgi:hypothetical protein